MDEDDFSKSIQKMMQHSKRKLMQSDQDVMAEKDKVERNLFFASIASGNHRSVHSFLLKGIPPDATNEEGRSGLHIAALSSHQDVFGTLLNKGADPDKADKSGITPLMCASQSGCIVIVDQLLEKNADVTKKTNDGLSAVFYALFNGHTKIAKKLEERKSCIHQLAEKPTASILEKAVTKNWLKVVRFMRESKCDVSYNTKLILASQAALCGHTEMLQYFPIKFEEKLEDGRSPLRCAVQNGFYNAVKYMLDNGCDVKNNEECVKVAILTGHLDILRLLVEKGAPIYEKDEQNVTPVQLALAQGSFEMLKYLVEQGCSLNPHEKMGSLCLMAASMRQVDILEFLNFFAEKSLNMDQPDVDTGETPLLALSEKGPIQAVEFLIDKGCNMNVRNRRDVTPALRAAHNKQEDILMLLGERGADLDVPNRIGETAILVAARNKSLSMVRYLADKSCRLDTKDFNGHGIAYYAVKANNVPLLNFLLQRKVSFDDPDKNGMTPLIIAVRHGAIDAIKLLTSRPNLCSIDHKDRAGKTALHHAVSKAKLDIIKHLTERAANLSTVDHAGNTLLIEARKHKRDYSVLEYLTENLTCDIQATNNEVKTAVHYACLEKTNDALMHLLEADAPFDTQDRDGLTPFMISAAQGSESLITVLKSVGADVNRRNHVGENAVHLAVKSGNLKIVQCFSLFGCVLDQEDNLGVTPLMIACSKNKLNMVRFLIKKNRADVNSIAHNGRTPAHFACESGSLSVIRLLQSHGAELDKPDLHGVTPVFLAAAKQDEEFLKFLSNSGCELSATDKSLKTVLHYAVESKNEAAVRFLLSIEGIDANALDENGTSPVMLSVQMGCDSILTLLQSKGGRVDETFDQESRSIAHLACAAGNLALLQETQDRVSLSSRTNSGENCLTIACANGHEEILKFLFEKRVHINYKNSLGDNALIVAVKNSHLDLVPLLLDAGVKVQETNLEKSNAVHILCSKPCSSKFDKVKMMKMETDEHLDDLKNSIEKTFRGQDELKPKFLETLSKTKELPDRLLRSKLPPGCVSTKAAIKCMKKMFKFGADVNAQNAAGKAALHIAAAGGSKAIVRFLLSEKADIDLKDEQGETPIFYAIRHGKEKVAELLLDRGADANMENNNGLSVFSLAVAVNCSKVVEILSSKGAEINIAKVVAELKLEDIFKYQNVKHLEFLLSKGFDGKKKENEQTMLHKIVLMGDIQLLKAIRRNPKYSFLKEIVNDQDADGNSALHLALMTGRLDMAEVLLGLQCKTNVRNRRHQTPLHVVASENKLSLVQWLFDKAEISAQPDAEEPKDCQSPLQISAAMGSLSVFKYLEQKGYKAETVCSSKNNCAHYAAIHGNLHILKHIFADSNQQNLLKEENAQQLTPFLCTVLNGHESAASFLYEKDPTFHDKAIDLLVQRGHQHMIDHRMIKGPQVQGSVQAPMVKTKTLLAAASSGNFHLIKKLTSGWSEWQTVQDDCKDGPAHAAACGGHRHLLRYFNENRVPPDAENEDGDTPILKCASAGHVMSMKMLQERGCNINQKNTMQRDVVHLACISTSSTKGHLNIVKFANDQQLPLDDADSQGNTGLMYACRRGFKDVAEFLLENDCDPDKANAKKLTAAHLAVTAGRSDILEILCARNASLNAEDQNETTPLMIAVYRNEQECAKLLVDKLDEAAIGKANKFGWSAMKIANRSGVPDDQREQLLSILKRKVRLPPENETAETIPEEQIVADIDMRLSSRPERSAAVTSVAQNLAVLEQPVDVQDDEDRSTYFGDIRCCKPKSVLDRTESSSRSVGAEDSDAEDNDGETGADEAGGEAGNPSAELLPGLPLSPPTPSDVSRCAQQ